MHGRQRINTPTTTARSDRGKSITSSMFSADDDVIIPRSSSRMSDHIASLPGAIDDDEVWDDTLSDSGFGLPVMEKEKGEKKF